MTNWTKVQFRNLMILTGALALVMVVVLKMLLAAELSQWIHIPLTVVVLTLLGGAALATGAAFVEYKARSVGSGEQAQ